jgi:signal transduction histidine kinase
VSLARILAGAAIGGLAAAGGALLGLMTGESTFAALPLLAVATVALTLGPAPAVAAYAVGGGAIIVQGILIDDELVSAATLTRVLLFMVGAPVVAMLAFRAERRRSESQVARDMSEAAERMAVRERGAADEARRELQVALQQVERERTRLEEVAEAIPEPLIVYDADGGGRYANRAALRTFGRSFYDRSLEEWGRLTNPRDDRGQPLAMAEWPQVRARDEVTKRRMLIRLPMSGRDLLVDVEGTPVPDGGCVLLLRDVGKEVDERRRLSRFASFVAHELRNPLAVAKARIELASREGGSPDDRDRNDQRALESVDAAIGVLERLELFSRAEAGRLEADRLRFDLRDATRASVEHLRATGSERSVEVTVSGDPEVHGDRQLTQQALANLLTNADRYSVDGAPIHVEINGGPAPELRVRDGGPGISDEVADTLFVDRVSSGRGLGLGLYLVRAAMEAQGGIARLEERTPSAVFLLRWPRRDADAADRSSSSATG